VAEHDDAIERLLKESMPDSIITNYIAIVEVLDDEGRKLRLSMSEGMTPWLALGMFQGGSRIIEAFDDAEELLGYCDGDDDDEEYDE
jgi:hypothetical protein